MIYLWMFLGCFVVVAVVSLMKGLADDEKYLR